MNLINKNYWHKGWIYKNTITKKTTGTSYENDKRDYQAI